MVFFRTITKFNGDRQFNKEQNTCLCSVLLETFESVESITVKFKMFVSTCWCKICCD